MSDEPTCGKGLAEHSSLPAKLGQLIDALAGNLELHQKSLDLSDDNSRKELEAYAQLAKEQRSIAGQLRATAERMAGYRDLPMGRHDERAFADPGFLAAFENFVERERELVVLLQQALERDQRMVEQMRGQNG